MEEAKRKRKACASSDFLSESWSGVGVVPRFPWPNTNRITFNYNEYIDLTNCKFKIIVIVA
jgi:hypothetical protein